MAIDVKKYKKKVSNQKPNFNLVPFIDILFTIMIFIVVTSNFSAADVSDTGDGTGKPNVTDTSGAAEYYVMPVQNLHTVTVDGQDMSYLISNDAVGVHARVIDEGEVVIRPGEIDITTPSGFNAADAVERVN